MQSTNTGEPLYGFPWNQAEMDSYSPLNRGLVTLMAFNDQGKPYPLGTGFVVSRDDRKATCLTAAHVITEIRNLQAPPRRHALSALAEFLPPPRAIDLSQKKVRAIAVEGDRGEVLVVDWAIVDEGRDIAVLGVSLQSDDVAPFFSGEFEADDTVPKNGSLVCILSYGDLATDNFVTDGGLHREFRMRRRPVLRCGTVIEYYPDGHRLCHGPCMETTIPVYSGMSGGPVFAFGKPSEPMRPFALVCSDPDADGLEKENRARSGSSIVALLPCSVGINHVGARVVKFKFPDAEVAGEIANDSRGKRL